MMYRANWRSWNSMAYAFQSYITWRTFPRMTNQPRGGKVRQFYFFICLPISPRLQPFICLIPHHVLKNTCIIMHILNIYSTSNIKEVIEVRKKHDEPAPLSPIVVDMGRDFVHPFLAVDENWTFIERRVRHLERTVLGRYLLSYHTV